jgi:hypothetical protein
MSVSFKAKLMLQLLSYFTMKIDGQEVFYKLYKDVSQNRYYSKTAEVTLRYPSFSAWRANGEWMFENVTDQNIRSQAIGEIRTANQSQAGPIL